ncbi:1749_t:CDS:10, partial [Funneliformis geosporum]
KYLTQYPETIPAEQTFNDLGTREYLFFCGFEHFLELVARQKATIQDISGKSYEDEKDLKEGEVKPAWKFLTACQTQGVKNTGEELSEFTDFYAKGKEAMAADTPNSFHEPSGRLESGQQAGLTEAQIEKAAIPEKTKKLEENLKAIPTTEEERNDLIKQIDEYPPYEGTDKKKYSKLQTELDALHGFGQDFPTTDIEESIKKAEGELNKEAIDLETHDYQQLKVACRLLQEIEEAELAQKDEIETELEIEAAITEAKNNTNSGRLEPLCQKLKLLNETVKEHKRKVLTDNTGLQRDLTEAIVVDADNKRAWHDKYPNADTSLETLEELYTKALTFNLKNFDDETEQAETLEIANLTEEEQGIITEAKTPEAIEKVWEKIITGRQKDREEQKTLVNQITETLAKFNEVRGSNEELGKLLDEINPVSRPSREAILAYYNIFFTADRSVDGGTMGSLHRLGWQCDRNEIEIRTPTAEGDGYSVSEKAPKDIAEGYLYQLHLQNGTTGEDLPDNWETYQGGRKRNVLTEEKGLVEAREAAKAGVAEVEKLIFEHVVLNSVPAINAVQVLLTKIKKTITEITAATASQAQAAVDELKDNYPVDENLNQELSASELKLFAASYVDKDEAEVLLEGHKLAELDTVKKVQVVHETLTLLRSFINCSFDEYTGVENLKDLNNLTFNIIDKIKNKLDDEYKEVKIGEENVFAFDLIDAIVDEKVSQLNENVRNL